MGLFRKNGGAGACYVLACQGAGVVQWAQKRRCDMKKLHHAALKEQIEGYFSRCEEEKRPPTVTGLSLALGCSAREELLAYTDRRRGQLVRNALLRIENGAEEKLFSKEYFSGAKLFLEVNFSRWSGEGGEDFDALTQLDATGTRDWAK